MKIKRSKATVTSASLGLILGIIMVLLSVLAIVLAYAKLWGLWAKIVAFLSAVKFPKEIVSIWTKIPAKYQIAVAGSIGAVVGTIAITIGELNLKRKAKGITLTSAIFETLTFLGMVAVVVLLGLKVYSWKTTVIIAACVLAFWLLFPMLKYIGYSTFKRREEKWKNTKTLTYVKLVKANGASGNSKDRLKKEKKAKKLSRKEKKLKKEAAALGGVVSKSGKVLSKPTKAITQPKVEKPKKVKSKARKSKAA